jgi:WD40 repeat protein
MIMDDNLWGVPTNADSVLTLSPTSTPTLNPSITPAPPGFTPTASPTGSLFAEYELYDSTMTAQALTLALTPSLTFTPSATPLPTVTPFVVTPQPGAEVITAANYERVTLLNTLQSSDNGRAYYQYTMFAADGTRLVMAGGTSMSVWDVIDGEQIVAFDEHPTFITSMDVSQDGQFALTLADDAVLRLWALSTGTLVNSIPLEGRTYSNFQIQLSPDNRRALVQEYAADDRFHLRVRDLETGEITFDQSISRDWAREMAGGFRPDGLAIWWLSGGVFSTNVTQTTPYISNQMYAPTEGENVLSADFTRLVTFSTERVNIHIWDTAGGRDPLLLQGHTAPVREAYFSPDARLLVSFDRNGELLVWDTMTGTNLTTIPEGMLPNGMNIGGGRWLLRAEDGMPLIWNLSSAFETLVLDVGINLSMGADGTTIAATNRGFVLIFGVPTTERPAYASVPGRIVPSAINIRPQPSLDAEPSGTVAQGVVVIAGRDSSGQFVYLPSVNGWALADPAYIELGDLLVQELPIREE